MQNIAQRSNVIDFPARHRAKIYAALIAVDGYKRRQWTVIAQHANGDWD